MLCCSAVDLFDVQKDLATSLSCTVHLVNLRVYGTARAKTKKVVKECRSSFNIHSPLFSTSVRLHLLDFHLYEVERGYGIVLGLCSEPLQTRRMRGDNLVAVWIQKKRDGIPVTCRSLRGGNHRRIRNSPADKRDKTCVCLLFFFSEFFINLVLILLMEVYPCVPSTTRANGETKRVKVITPCAKVITPR